MLNLTLSQDLAGYVGFVVHNFAPFNFTKYKESALSAIYIHRAASPRPAFIVDLGVGIITGEHIPGVSTGIRTQNRPVMSRMLFR